MSCGFIYYFRYVDTTFSSAVLAISEIAKRIDAAGDDISVGSFLLHFVEWRGITTVCVVVFSFRTSRRMRRHWSPI